MDRNAAFVKPSDAEIPWASGTSTPKNCTQGRLPLRHLVHAPSSTNLVGWAASSASVNVSSSLKNHAYALARSVTDSSIFKEKKAHTPAKIRRSYSDPSPKKFFDLEKPLPPPVSPMPLEEVVLPESAPPVNQNPKACSVIK